MRFYSATLSRLLTAATLLFSPIALAEQAVSDGRYEIHYNAFNSSFITPEVAQQNGLIRSKYRALVNVSVLKIEEDGSKSASTAVVSGQAANLLGQAQQLEFKKIDEGNALYYIGGFRFTEDEQLKITLSVQPDPNKPAYTIEFDQRFYVD
ncbi:DUF4426 domain-containing protein [Marinobacterium sediminicola]|uniref:DUF4426 domain-containing protein n=1 Tax=Marinobacterium sediminicola TaxID=518898 RepID=A0ABY1RZK3_9GAMM|nr:DUF4426 domain-containing protein [Marinobacterium sediminicola]ULG69080.1 DUF4426 domain-containing protein [Marinobacterium sediminicola]SMR73642.1 protein of unknown function [Marinobacterium sediminicola]